MKINKLPEGCFLMSNKISKKIAASLISVLVFGSQLPSGSACPHDESLSVVARAKANENNIELKGIFDVPGLKEALERANRYYGCLGYNFINAFIDVSLESRDGRVVVKLKDESFELAYDKLIDKETGEIEEIEIPYLLNKIGSSVFKDILKNANAQGKKIKKVILPENLECAFGAFEDVSVDCVVFKSSRFCNLDADIFKNASRIGAVFVAKRFEEEAKKTFEGQNFKIFQDFELKSVFNIKGLKEDIMEALVNKKAIYFKGEAWGSCPFLWVGNKEFHPDYSKLKDEKTGKIENLELPYGINYINSPLIYNMCFSCDKNLGNSEINRIVIPDTVKYVGKGTFCHVNANHVIFSKNLGTLTYKAFGWTVKKIGFGDIFMGPNCKIREITAPAKFEPKLKSIFKNQKTEFNLI